MTSLFQQEYKVITSSLLHNVAILIKGDFFLPTFLFSFFFLSSQTLLLYTEIIQTINSIPINSELSTI